MVMKKKIFGVFILCLGMCLFAQNVMAKNIGIVNDSNIIVKLAKSKGDQDVPSKNEQVEDRNVGDLCSSDNFKKPLKYVGWVLAIVKIVVPILIIVMGVIDFFKVFTSAKGDEIPKALRSLAMRAIAGIVIFFIPALINFLFSLIDDWNDYQTNYSECTKCLYEPSSC